MRCRGAYRGRLISTSCCARFGLTRQSWSDLCSMPFRASLFAAYTLFVLVPGFRYRPLRLGSPLRFSRAPWFRFRRPRFRTRDPLKRKVRLYHFTKWPRATSKPKPRRAAKTQGTTQPKWSVATFLGHETGESLDRTRSTAFSSGLTDGASKVGQPG